MPNISVVPLGQVDHKVNLRRLLRLATKAQSYYSFHLTANILIVGEPTAKSPRWVGSPDQYLAESLTEVVITGGHSQSAHVLVGVIDAYVYDELFSTMDRDNRVIIVSTKIDGLGEILRASNKTYEEYVLLEMAVQLLAVEYRRVLRVGIPPEECGLPWHAERRGCVFDYYGLAADDVRKLMTPRLCPECARTLHVARVPDAAQHACLEMIRKGLRPRLVDALRSTATSTWGTLLLGAWLGAILGRLIEGGSWFVGVSVAIVLILLIGTIEGWRRNIRGATQVKE